MNKSIAAMLAMLGLWSATAGAQSASGTQPPRQAGASGANSDQQGWTPGAPLLSSKKAHIHKPASSASSHRGFFNRKKSAAPSSSQSDGAKPLCPADSSQ